LRIEHDGDSREMEKFLDQLEAGSRIAIEATANWWWVVDLAEKHGHEVVLSKRPSRPRNGGHFLWKSSATS
jgi:ATP-dependent DNA ligase